MWFKREARNRKRRRKRTHLLDVKLRSRQVNAARARATALMVGVSCGTVFGLYLLWRAGDWALNRLVLENQAFALRTIELSTDGQLSNEQILRWSRIKGGENLLALDLARVKRDLEWVANIQSVSLERVLPRTLRIRVLERVPIARVVAPQLTEQGVRFAVYHLDAQGFVMKPLDPAQCRDHRKLPDEQLPRLVGFPASELRPGHQVNLPRVRAALDLIQAFDKSPMSGVAGMQQIDVGQSGALVLSTTQGTEATFGAGHFDRQLRRWRVIHDRGLRMGLSILSLDLAVTNNIPIRWAQDVPQPAQLRPTRTRATAGQQNV